MIGGLGTCDGEGDLEAGAVGECVEKLQDRIGGVAADFAAAVGAVNAADFGEEESEVVVDFGRGGDGGLAADVDGSLADGDRRGDVVDAVGVGALQPVEELAGVGGEALDVAALALGVEGVEGEAAFARAADAADDDQLVERDVERDVLQVVDAYAFEVDGVAGGGGRRDGGGSRWNSFWNSTGEVVGVLNRKRCSGADAKQPGCSEQPGCWMRRGAS